MLMPWGGFRAVPPLWQPSPEHRGATSPVELPRLPPPKPKFLFYWRGFEGGPTSVTKHTPLCFTKKLTSQSLKHLPVVKVNVATFCQTKIIYYLSCSSGRYWCLFPPAVSLLVRSSLGHLRVSFIPATMNYWWCGNAPGYRPPVNTVLYILYISSF